MRTLRGLRLWLPIVLSLLSAKAVYGEYPLYRIVYDDDPVLKLDRQLAEDAYGAKLLVVPVSKPPPKNPEHVWGFIFPIDHAFDSQWYVGVKSEGLRFQLLKQWLEFTDPSMGDIEEKVAENRFTAKMFPELAPPAMTVMSDFDKPDPQLTKTILEKVQRQLPAKLEDDLKRVHLTRDELVSRLVRLEQIRLRAQQAQGTSILKVRDLSHSEGRLPKTDQDWISLYIDYMTHTRPEVMAMEKRLDLRMEKEMQASGGTAHPKDLAERHRVRDGMLQADVLPLPFIEGRVLDQMLEDPTRVVANKMIKIGKEVRVHIVNGNIVYGATFLRFYKPGLYLSQPQIDELHQLVRDHFVGRLMGVSRHFSTTMDLAFDEDTKRWSIIDLNDGLNSGYYYPDEDLFTTNFLAWEHSGRKPKFLLEWDEVKKAPLGPEKLAKLKAMLKKYRPFFLKNLKGPRYADVLEAFWDRLILHAAEEIGRAPDTEKAKVLDSFLLLMRDAGLRRPSIYHQLLAEVQDRWPQAVPSPARERYWVKFLNGMESDFKTELSNGRFVACPFDQLAAGT